MLVLPRIAREGLSFRDDIAFEGHSPDDLDWEVLADVRFWPANGDDANHRHGRQQSESAAEPSERIRVKPLEVKLISVRLLETHRAELVATNGLLAAAAAIHSMMEMEKPVKPDTVRRYIQDRFWELAREMHIPPSPTSKRDR